MHQGFDGVHIQGTRGEGIIQSVGVLNTLQCSCIRLLWLPRPKLSLRQQCRVLGDCDLVIVHQSHGKGSQLRFCPPSVAERLALFVQHVVNGQDDRPELCIDVLDTDAVQKVKCARLVVLRVNVLPEGCEVVHGKDWYLKLYWRRVQGVEVVDDGLKVFGA